MTQKKIPYTLGENRKNSFFLHLSRSPNDPSVQMKLVQMGVDGKRHSCCLVQTNKQKGFKITWMFTISFIAFSNSWKVETILEHDPCPPLAHIKVFSLTSVFCRHTHLVLSQSRSYLDYCKVLALVWSSSRALLSWERWNTGIEAVQQIQTLRGRIHNTLVYIGPTCEKLRNYCEYYNNPILWNRTNFQKSSWMSTLRSHGGLSGTTPASFSRRGVGCIKMILAQLQQCWNPG